MHSSTPRRVLRWAGLTLGGLLAVVLLVVVAIYAWPLRTDRLTHADAATLSFAEASARAAASVQADEADPAVLPECRTKALLHPARTGKAVLMLHGYTDCPAQFADLAQLWYDRGYNVFVPRAPRQGVTDALAHAGLHADELVDYAQAGLTVTTGLGDEVGVVGLSGGGVLATWLSEYRPDAVRRLLVMSPFYAPAAGQAPSWQVKPLIILYGNRIVADRVNDAGFSYAALSQYLRIARVSAGDRDRARLTSVGIVTSPLDTYVDLTEARQVPADLAEASKVELVRYELPAAWGIGHDLVEPKNLGEHGKELAETYLNLYEGRPADQPGT